MSDSGYKTLTDAQALVLFVVWAARARAKAAQSSNGQGQGRAPGLTNVQIQEAVAEEYFKSGKKKGFSLPNIKIYIASLINWKPVPLLVPAPRAGKEATVYFLEREHLVRRSPIASMLIQLEDEPDGSIARSIFIEQVERKDLKNFDGTLYSREKIDEALRICMKPPYPYVVEDASGYLSTTERVGRERRFLDLIRNPETSNRGITLHHDPS